MDSLAAVELRNNIQARFGIEVPATITFDYPNIEALAKYIDDRMSFAKAKPMHNRGTRLATKHVRTQKKQAILTYEQYPRVLR